MFIDVMARLTAGVTVVTARRSDGGPCGLLVSSLCSYSVAPPSVLFAIDQSARSYPALCAAREFGVHLLVAAQTELAGVFAGRGRRKFDQVGWDWDGAVPRLDGVADYLRCRTSAVIVHGDHAVVIGEVNRCESRTEPTEPLVYYGRRLGWRLTPPE
jgi:flavin reductase ActVB